MELRPATMADLDLLLAWRNDPITRQASLNPREVTREEHTAWLTAVLADPNRNLYIAEEGGEPVGTVRADFSKGSYLGSYTVAPLSRGRGLGKPMVTLLVECTKGDMRLEIRAGNTSSIRIAEATGFHFQYEADGILHYFRQAAT